MVSLHRMISVFWMDGTYPTSELLCTTYTLTLQHPVVVGCSVTAVQYTSKRAKPQILIIELLEESRRK
jgi:hypothetical protein